MIVTITKETVRFIISVACAVIFALTTIWAVRTCSSYKDINEQNLIALTDTIQYYKTKNNELYVSKTLLNGDLNTLKIVNDSLYGVVKSMKLKNTETVIYVDNIIDNGKHDTAWVISHDTLFQSKSISRNFAFNNEFRTLEGSVFASDSTLGLNIDKDKVFFDYTLAVEDNKVYLKSNNPYIQYNQIQGITLPKQKKSWTSLVVGPSVGYGYDFNAKKFGFNVGLNATWGIRIK